jgi:UDP-N-acetylglucosamine 2-epimerase (non-hydrolysing)
MTELNVLSVVGCRPNFIKIAPLMAQMNRQPEISATLVHTGQHYDPAMSEIFFRDLDIPEPHFSLDVGSGSYAYQTAEVMQRLERVLLACNPDLVIVVGDVNSTLASALTAVPLGIPVAHVEAGLRSFDREMPEEINRVLTDAAADLLFTTEESAVDNLLREGKDRGQIYFAGNVMIDSLLQNLPKIERSGILRELNLDARRYSLLTLHRPSNVDEPETLHQIAQALRELGRDTCVIFPAHPRTAARLEQSPSGEELLSLANFHVIEPLGYIDFIKLMKESAFVLTDSGGVQEETTALGVPCLTLRENTERPVTLTEGTNRLVGTSPSEIVRGAREVLKGNAHHGRRPPLWDGHAAERIVSVLLEKSEEIRRLYHRVRERRIWLHSLNPASLSR